VDYPPENMRSSDRRLGLTDIERDWTDAPWLNQVERDRPFEKTAKIDLDLEGGVNPTVTIAIGGLSRQYIIIDQVELVALDDPSMEETLIETTLDGKPMNRARVIDVTPDVENDLEVEHFVDRFFKIPPSQIYRIIFTNESPFNRSRWDVKIKGFISRIVN
jgi:hypothetical protein